MTDPARWETLFDRGTAYDVDREALLAAHGARRAHGSERDGPNGEGAGSTDEPPEGGDA